MHSFRMASVVPAARDAVWARATTIEGVNAELWPIAQMTGEGEIAEGPLGRSWILAFGLLPIDYDDICLEAVMPGRGFRERSRMGSCSAWHHDRTLTAVEGGTRVVDEIAFTPRVPGTGGLLAFTFAATFRWRHRRLARQWS